MPTTIASGFQQLRTNLEITSLQGSTVSTRQSKVRRAVENGLPVIDSFVGGSYARSTMISPLKESDLDIFIILDAHLFNKYTPASLLDRIRTILLRSYPTTPRISRNGQAVTIAFTDFQVDVVPGFVRQGGGYLIPDSISGRWISTNPKIHSSRLSAENSVHGSNLIPLIKMVKGWNRCINSAFNGFYLELMTSHILRGVTITDFPSGVRYIFDKGQTLIQYRMIDPAGYGGEIDPMNNVNSVVAALKQFTTAYNQAVFAEQYARQGDVRRAYEEWNRIFPNYFPSYG